LQYHARHVRSRPTAERTDRLGSARIGCRTRGAGRGNGRRSLHRRAPFADQPPDFGRPPDGEDIVGGRYHAQLYFSAPYTDWPSGQVITYLYQDDRGRQWCPIAYFGTPFEQDMEHLAMLGQIVASIQHPS
jgi:hypothetical protein